MSKEYYESYWHDWVKTMSKWRRWTLPLGITSLLLCLVLYLNVNNIPIKMDLVLSVLFLFGVVEILWHFWSKWRWFSQMEATIDLQAENIFVFTREGIDITGPHSQGSVDWGAFKKVVAADNGLFFVLQKGVSIYVPDQAFDVRDGKVIILDMLNQYASSYTEKDYELPSLDFDVQWDQSVNSCSIEFIDDDKTPMGFVVAILEKYFGLSHKNARNKMLEIHSNGKTEISGIGTASAAKLVAHVEKVAMESGFPLKCNVQNQGELSGLPTREN